MNRILTCRRTFLALVAMVMLFVLGYINEEHVAAHIVAIVLGIAGANAAQGVLTKPVATNSEIPKC